MKLKLKVAGVVVVVLLAVGVVGLVLTMWWTGHQDAAIDYAVRLDASKIPHFEMRELDHAQRYDSEGALPLTAGAVLDVDGEPPEELFVGGGVDQSDVLYRYDDGEWVDITDEAGLGGSKEGATLSAVHLDVDADGDDDLIVTRTDEIVLYENADARFRARVLDAPMDPSTSPASVALADLNRDGLFDMYVCGYVKVAQMQGVTNFSSGYGGFSRLLINRGGDSFEDVTESAGLTYQHNTFQAVFRDVDADGLEDLVVAHDTGHVRTYRNEGDLRFSRQPNPSSETRGYPMGIAVGDFDNDGHDDFFFSNVGTTVPQSIGGGSGSRRRYHPEWMLFRGLDGFAFADVAEAAKLAKYEFSWGAIFEDFNLDGRADLVVSENYIDFPGHKYAFTRLPGRFLIQNEDGEFAAVGEEAGVENPRFGIAPLSADFNLDGFPDLVHVNLDDHSRVFMSSPSDDAHWIKVRLPNTVASIGATAVATLGDGRTVVEPFVVGEGLCSDSTHVITIGAGESQVESLEVRWLGGGVTRIDEVRDRETLTVSAAP